MHSVIDEGIHSAAHLGGEALHLIGAGVAADFEHLRQLIGGAAISAIEFMEHSHFDIFHIHVGAGLAVAGVVLVGMGRIIIHCISGDVSPAFIVKELIKTAAVSVAVVIMENVAHWAIGLVLAVAPPAAAAVMSAAAGMVGGAFIAHSIVGAVIGIIEIFGTKMDTKNKCRARLAGAAIGAIAVGVVCIIFPHIGAAVAGAALVGMGLYGAWYFADWIMSGGKVKSH